MFDHDACSCCACGSGELTVFFELLDQPVHVGVQWPTPEAARRCPRGDIRLAFCRACGLISNTAFDPDPLDYRRCYENALDFSPLYQEYALGLAASLIERHDLRNKTIVEIGSGRGEFLRLLCKLGGNQGIGFDPNCDAGTTGEGGEERIRFIRDFYSQRYAAYRGDLVCCRQVLEHIAEPRRFLSMVREAIGDEASGVVYFEVPNARYVLRDLAVWTIIYEHCSYFSAGSLARLFDCCGFSVGRVEELYQGTFLGLEAAPSNGRPPPLPRRYDDLGAVGEAVLSFNDGYRGKMDRWRAELAEMERQAKRAVAWGAGARAVAFLNALGITEQIPYVVDINARKVGKYLPGTAQRIVGPAFLRDYRPDVVILMNGIYEGEIQRSVEQLGLRAEYLIA